MTDIFDSVSLAKAMNRVSHRNYLSQFAFWLPKLTRHLWVFEVDCVILENYKKNTKIWVLALE